MARTLPDAGSGQNINPGPVPGFFMRQAGYETLFSPLPVPAISSSFRRVAPWWGL